MRVRAAVLMAVLAGTGIACREVSAPGTGDGGVNTRTAGRDLATILDAEWEWRLRENPQFATTVGDHRYDDQLSKESIEDETRRSHDTRRFLDDVSRIDRARLTPAEQVTFDMFRAELEDRIATFRFREYLLPINADSGFHSGFALMPQTLRLESVKDYDNYLARLRAFPRYVDEYITRMRKGLEVGITVPRVALQGADTAIAPLMPDDPTASPLYGPFRAMPATFAAADRSRLEAAGRTAVAESVTPAYARFREFLSTTYIPGARDTIAASALPEGAAYYQHLVKRFTTLPLTSDQVHARGVAEVARIRAEMEAVMRGTGFTGDFAAFLRCCAPIPASIPGLVSNC